MKFEHQTLGCQVCENRFNSIFCKESNDQFEGIEKEKICSPYQKGEFIFRSGMPPQGIFCLNYGKIKIIKKENDGAEKILRLVRPGDPMGYRSILSEEMYSCSAVALEECGVCFIPKELFLSVINKDEPLTKEMIKLLGVNLREAETQIANIVKKSTLERTAEAILFIKETYGYHEDGKTINATLSRSDIANIVGTNTETVVRHISEFKKCQVISLNNKNIVIEDLPRLVNYANMYD